jgi:hypothetical protein
MPFRLTLKAINEELARRGHRVLLEKGDGYFYFRTGEAADWLERSVPVRNLTIHTLKEWIAEFERLKALNAQLRKTLGGAPQRPAAKKRGNPGPGT